MNMEKMNTYLNRILSLVTVLCTLLCLMLGVQVIQRKDVNLFGVRVYNILTGSMEPTIPTGAIVLTKETDFADLEPGDIITFTSRDPALNGSANTHRILRVEADESGRACLVTKGDNNTIEDEYRVYTEDIKGKVVYYSHMNGFSTFLAFVRTGPGFLTVVVMPLMLVAWWILRDFTREVKATLRAQVEEEMKQAQAAEKIAPTEAAAPETGTETAEEKTQ